MSMSISMCVTVVSFEVSLHPAYGNDYCKVQRGFVRYRWNYKAHVYVRWTNFATAMDAIDCRCGDV